MGMNKIVLSNAEKLLRNGLSLTDIVKGYKISKQQVLENILPSLSLGKIDDLLDSQQVARIIKTSLSSKQYGYEDFLSKLIADTCISTIPNGASVKSFSVDSVRICKIIGGGVTNSSMVKGMMFKRLIESDITQVDNAVIASIAAQGVNVIVTGGKVADMALHFCNKYKIMVLRLMSKWDLRRLCKTVGSICLPKLQPPSKEELGYCQKVHLDCIGEQQVVIFDKGTDSSSMSTVLIRGATDNILDDIERAVDDGVNNFKILSKKPENAEYVAGAGAVEMAIATRLTAFGQKIEGLEQYSVETFAHAFENFPRALADNSGLPAQEVISLLYNAHGEGKPATMGVNIESNVASPALLDAAEAGIIEPLEIKKWAIKYAVDAAVTILSVDSVIMAKPAGGPKPRAQKAADWDDDDM